VVVGTVLAVVVMAVTVIIALVVVVAHRAIDPGSPADFFFMALFGLFSIDILVGRLEHLIDRDRWFPVKLPAELIMMIEPANEIGHHFGF